ncbi:arylesterase [Pseudocolwellia sp. AS88]|uniref:arylesterase n=1 Tax=Pseudocolwellia sp. AS88 TaxID=3063958 RepID=UPI0026F3092F|nr:arylesterase [Pseudocolwellia sp. AS88]MDO7084430.1 arylesterase [Pseudocolwellia sp. AS88]
MKKHPIFTLVFLCYLLSVTTASAKDSILLLGDSVSASYGMQQNEGWVHLLNQQLTEQNAPYEIVNASISGETTTGGLSRLESILNKNKVDHLLIELGGNDGLRGFPPKLIKNNLLQMIDIAKSKNIPVSMFSIKIPPNYGPRYTKMFEEVFSTVANEKSIKLIPFFVEFVAVKPDLMQADGIHPNAKAQPIIADIVREDLRKLLE